MADISDGYYEGVVVGWALGKTSTGKEQVAVDFVLPDVGAQQITWYGYFTDASTDITLKALRTLGWVGDDISDLSSINEKRVQLAIRNETYEGKTRPKVKFINPLGGGPSLKEQMTEGEAQSFAARMRARVKAFDKANGAAPVTGKPVAKKAAKEDESDLPF